MASELDAAKRRELLVRAGLALASELSLPAVLQKIVDLACRVTRARYGALAVYGPDRRIQEFVTHGVTAAEREAIGAPPEGKGLLGALLLGGRPLRLASIPADRRSTGFPPGHPPMTSFLGVPIATGGRAFGNLYLTDKVGAPKFTDDDEWAAATLSRQAGVAVENATRYRETQVARRRLEAANEVTEAILEGRDTLDVLRMIARRARELVGATIATVATPDRNGDELVLRVADGDRAEELLGTRFPAGRIGDIGPTLFVPLAGRGRVFGAITVANRIGENPFSTDDVTVVQTFAGQAAVALEYARIQEELQRLALAEERERIAKELHDDVIQSLFAEGMALQAAEAMVDDPEAMTARLSSAVDHIDRVIRDLRSYIFGLRPGAFADRHLDGALRALAEGFAEGGAASITVEADPEAVSRLAGRASDVLQAAREAISNAVRHSGGEHVSVTLAGTEDGAAVLEIEDNGKGFDPSIIGERGQGLLNLRARAEALGGDLAIDSEPGRGSRLRIRIPL
ncbi:MAG: GAF domain-containing sensor histidine kinase [Acidobacteria bacterium]|nr:GAF domain-containing sensor histidine kinase [Acidobacteriota bacterium]